ncbi:MAG: hypothetical protein HY796_10885 [Elusimicrobia bacterium]|nr:hypothetical protein [Elusimicrobiota bacterium]
MIDDIHVCLDALKLRKIREILRGELKWPKFLGNGPMASALLRRLLHNCHTITFPKGINLSKPKHALSPQDQP